MAHGSVASQTIDTIIELMGGGRNNACFLVLWAGWRGATVASGF